MKRPERDYDLLVKLQEILGDKELLLEMAQGLDKDEMNELLDHIAQMHDIHKGENDES